MEGFMCSKEIRGNVKKRLLRNTLLKDESIIVDMEGEEVILQANVDSFDKKWLAEDIAADTFGVMQVKNEILIMNEKENGRRVFYEEE